jgi:hypothetical protein
LKGQGETAFSDNSIQMLTTFVAAILADHSFHAAARMAMIAGAPEAARSSQCPVRPLKAR